MAEEISAIECSGQIANADDLTVPSTREDQRKEVVINIFKITRLHNIPIFGAMFTAFVSAWIMFFLLFKIMSANEGMLIETPIMLTIYFLTQALIARKINRSVRKYVDRLRFMADRSAYCKDLIEFAMRINDQFSSKFSFSNKGEKP